MLGLGFAWTLENLVVSLSREERDKRLNRLNLYLGNVCLRGLLPLGVSTHPIYAKGLLSAFGQLARKQIQPRPLEKGRRKTIC